MKLVSYNPDGQVIVEDGKVIWLVDVEEGRVSQITYEKVQGVMARDPGWTDTVPSKEGQRAKAMLEKVE